MSISAHSSLKADNGPYANTPVAMLGVSDEGNESNYTPELYAYIGNGTPNRSAVAPRKMGRGSNVGIYEDRVQGTSVHGLGRHETSRQGFKSYENNFERTGRVSKDSGLPQPVQALPGRAAAEHNRAVSLRHRLSALLAERQDVVKHNAAATSYKEPEGLVRRQTTKRKSRRMTVYIPSDDTTIQTIHPRVISSRNEFSGQHAFLKWINPALDPVNGGNLYAKASGQTATGSAGAIAARRVPLQTLSTSTQENTAIPDKFGKGGGKENIPPARLGRPHCLSKAKRVRITGQVRNPDSTAHQVEAVVNDAGAVGCGSIAVSRTISSGKMNRCDRLGSSRNFNPSLGNDGFRSTTESRCSQREDVRTAHRGQATPKQPCEGSLGELKEPRTAHSTQGLKEPYPLLSDISEPQLYEENWLAHQEAAITQLVNCLFESFEDDKRARESLNVNLTKRLIRIYHGPPFPILYQQLQASLLHGALSAPKGIAGNASRLESDIGLRRDFLDLWMNTYEPAPLQAATEAVIGRKVPEVSEWSKTPTNGGQRGAKQRAIALRTFLDVFLLQNEDISQMGHGVEDTARSQQTNHQFSTAGRLGQRTTLRSLLLVLLLDRAKHTGAKHTEAISSCLFLPSSLHKSSVCVVNALRKLLLPSVGDVHRALRQLGYAVHHIQHPLQEYRYQIVNLATDLRDGVRLTHLVELLRYSSAVISPQSEHAASRTLDDELSLDFLRQRAVRPLSSLLEMPCAARSQKVRNVQIALDALCGVTAMSGIARALRAHDIVDGHREKTVGLLWALVSEIGLGTLVDLKELEKETCRFRERSSQDSNDREADRRFQERPDEPASALIAWAGSIARLHQLSLENISTAFADGKIFEKIVDEYAAYMPYLRDEQKETRSKSTGLEIKLRRLGCNRYFGEEPFPSTNHLLEPSVVMLLFVPSTDTKKSRSSAGHLTLVTSSTVTLSWRHSPFWHHASSALPELVAQRSSSSKRIVVLSAVGTFTGGMC